MRLPGVQPHPHPRHGTLRPRLALQPELARAGRLDRRNRAGKDSEETVTLPPRGHHHPAVPPDHLGQKTIMPPQSFFHRAWYGFPQPRRPLDIGQQERDRPGRQLRPRRLVRAGWRRLGAGRRAREALAQQDGEVVSQQPFQLPRGGERPVGHGARRPDVVDHRRQPRLLAGRRALEVQQHRFARGQPVLILQARDVHPRRDPAVALPVDAHEHLALLQVGPVHAARRVRPGAGLIPHRNQVQPPDRTPGGRPLPGQAVRILTLCRDRDYAGGHQECPGGRVHACQVSGIIPGPRGTRGACPAAGTCPSSSLAARSGPGPSP